MLSVIQENQVDRFCNFCLFTWVCVCVLATLFRMDQVIVHVGCMSLKDSQELVSCCLDVVCNYGNIS